MSRCLRLAVPLAVLAHEALIEAGDLVIEPSQLRASVAGELVKLRLKEFQLLLALAKEPGALLTRQRLARDVWGYDHLASSRTIDVHIRRLRQAIEEASDYTYIQTVHGAGYRFEPRRKTERS
jgi:DNA-binding response OmpR family regulator